MRDLFNQYKYKLGYALCILAALLVTYASINTLFGGSMSGQAPNAKLHIGAFSLVIFLVVLAICFNLKDRRGH